MSYMSSIRFYDLSLKFNKKETATSHLFEQKVVKRLTFNLHTCEQKREWRKKELGQSRWYRASWHFIKSF